MRQKMSLEETSTNVAQKVFFIFVELMQNVINYSGEKGPAGGEDSELRFGVLIIGKHNEHFYIQCGNYIETTPPWKCGEEFKEDLEHVTFNLMEIDSGE